MSVLTPTKPPYMNFNEEEYNPFVNGDGADIPVFIGKTQNAGDPTKILTFKNYGAVNKDPSLGGLGIETDTLEKDNPLQYEIKQFFKESARTTNSDVGIPKIYVIDVGEEPTVEIVLKALATAKKKRDIKVIAFPNICDIALATAVNSDLVADTKNGVFKLAYYRADSGLTIADMCKFTDETQTTFIQQPRTNILVYEQYGKSVARICLTEYYIEPGYHQFRSIKLGELPERSPEERQALFNAGIIFAEDDYTLENPIPRICAGTSTAFGKDEDERPNDSLLHARRNADHQIRKLLYIIAPQLKRNETQTNIRYIQADCESYLENEKSKGRIMDYDITVEESDSNPYSLIVSGNITPVNSTYAIDVSCYINSPNMKVSDEV